MYYLSSTNEDEFVSTAIKLGYRMLMKKMDHITSAAMWQESKISKKIKELYWNIYQISLIPG